MKTNKYPYIIAEIGGNHNGDMELAKKMILQAKNCGCDAIKLQLWLKDDIFTDNYLKELNDGLVKLENIDKWDSKELGLHNIFDQVKKFAIGKKEHVELFDYARQIGVDYSSTALSKDYVDFLIEQKVAFLKVASMDINNIEFLEYIISKNYPTIISTGLASIGEIENVVNLIPEEAKINITLLHCVSLYPPRDEIVNLNFISTLESLFGLEVGYSDHTLGFSIPLAAIALGAKVIEKHFTLDKNLPGWDHKVSADPREMKIICEESKRIVNTLGNGKKDLTQEELDKRMKFRRSFVTMRKLKSGEILAKNDVTLKRPGTGIQAHEMKYIIGRQLKRDIDENQTILWEDLE